MRVGHVAVPQPFRLGAVVRSHGWFQTAPFRAQDDPELLVRAERLPGGVAVLTVRHAEGGVEVEADRPLDPPDVRAALARVGRMVQARADLGGLDAAARAVDPVLADELARLRAGRVLAGASLFEDVAKSVAATNTRWAGAVTSIARIAALDPEGGFPRPGDLIAAGEDRLRQEARVGYRARYLVALARMAEQGALDAIERDAPTLDGAALAARLRTLPGVGPSTAAFVAMLMGRYDLPSVDSAVIRHTSTAWFAGDTPTPAQVRDRVAPAGPFAGLVLAWLVVLGWQRETGLIP